MHRFAQGLARLNNGLANAVRWLVTAQALVMICAVLWGVFTRVALSRSPPWSEELALLMFTWIILLMTAAAVREFSHIRLDSLLALLPDSLSNIADRVISFVMAALGAYLLWSGIDYLDETSGMRSAAIRYPTEMLYASMPVASALMILYGLERALFGVPQEERAVQ